MDLIYTDGKGIDQGVILNPTLDMEIGGTEDFELTLPTDFKLESHSFIYVEGTEIFGIVDKRNVDTSEGSIVYAGRTIRGILNSKIIEPPSGQDYRIVSGKAVDILNSFAAEQKINGFVVFSGMDAKLTSFQIDRYVSFLVAADKMLAQLGAKMTFNFSDGIMHIVLAPVMDYSDDVEYDNRNIGFSVKQNFAPINHMICLGKGDLAQRQVIHLYADKNGNISKTQTLFGLEEVTEIYDYSSAESLDELERGGIKRIKESRENVMQVTLINTDQYDVGDIVGGREEITGIEIKEKITSKIITIKDNILSVEHKVGEKE